MQDTTKALYSVHDQVLVLALAGPVRYPAAKALRRFVDDKLPTFDANAIVVDLRKTTFVDSTGLGLLARIAKQSIELKRRRAILVCPQNDVALVLRSSALDTLCDIVAEPPSEVSPTEALPLSDEPAERSALGPIILDAHRDLAELSGTNRNEYAALIAALEAELRANR